MSKYLWVMAALALIMISAVALYPIFKVDISSNTKESKEVTKSISKALKERTESAFPEGEYTVNFHRRGNIWSTTALVSDRDLINLAKNKEVDNLSMRFCEITAKGFKVLEDEPLKSMQLYVPIIGPEEMKAISKLESLQDLTLRDNEKIDDKLISYLTGPHTLKELSFKKAGLGDKALAHLVDVFPNLTSLELWGNKAIGAKGLKELAKIKTLENLNLNEIELDRASLKELAKNKHIKSLQLINCQLNDKDIQGLRNSKVRDLYLAKNPLSNSSLPLIASLPKLKMVVLVSCPNLTPEAISKLKRVRPRLKVVASMPKVESPRKAK